MKIRGPGSGQPTDGVGDASDVERSGGKDFANKLEGSQSVAAPSAQSKPADAERIKSFVSDIGDALESGSITPEAALDQVVDRVLDNQLGTDAPAKLRSQVETAMRDAIETDPVLGAKIKSLSS
jgi:hypothetical protein